MQFFKYILLALVGSTGVGIAGETPNATSVKPLSEDVIVQPNGGAPSSFVPEQKKDLHTRVSPALTKQKKRRHSKKYKTDTKKDGFR